MNSRLYILMGMALCLGGAAMATPIGTVNIANCGGGGVTVTGTTITWSPVGTVAGTGCDLTGIGTSITYSGGTLGSGVTGNIKNLTAGGGLVDLFMTFAGTPLDFQLTGLGPGSANTTCAGLAVGASCSVFAGSPFVLTNVGGGNTLIGLHAIGMVTDGVGFANWGGSYSTQLTSDAGTIQSTILAGGSIASTYSGQFTLTAIPEPASVSMLLLGGIALLGIGRRIRKA